jgi:S1-C subfamily serine protease
LTTRTPALIAAALLLAASAGRAEDKKENDIRRSVVRITATQRYPNLLKPWMKLNPHEVSGSGVVIDGQRILTNAHLVSYASQIYVEPYHSSDKLAATVERIAPDIDLALLKVDDATFWKDRRPVQKARELPEGKDAISIYGYPIGDSSLAVTRGTVARILYAPLASEYGLHIQIDGAVNPGNSGGPALVKDRMIGVIVAASTEGQNIGYAISNEEIDEFLRRPQGKEAGKPYLQDDLQLLLNDALRSRLRLDRSVRGILVRAPALTDPAYPLRKGDVITRVGPYAIDNDGMVHVRDNLSLAFPYAVNKVTRDGRVPVTLLRQGKEQKLAVPVVRSRRTLLKRLDGKYPSYAVYGPLVFSPATSSFLRGMDGQFSEGSPLMSRWNDDVARAGEELVVVTCMLPHRLAKGYSDPTGQVVKQVNGTRIHNLRHLVETLSECSDAYVEIEFHEKHVETLVFDRKQVLAAMEDILSDNNIGKPCSDDVRAAWKKD